MPLISLSGVKKTFAERLLFEDVSFDVSEKDRVGLVGVNGCGKTTLFRIIMGLEPIDSGSIYKSSELKIGVMNQSVENFDGTLYDYTLLEFSHLSALENEIEELNLEISSACSDELDKLIKKQDQKRERFEREGGLTYRARTRSVLLGLGFSDDEIKKELKHMSGGQKNKAQLARVLLSGANLLLLDEPTNHLDISSVTWLEDYILSMKCAVIVISHDRYFLDRVTNKTIELKNCRIKQTNGNYTRHIELCSTERELALRKYRKTQSEIRRIEGIVEQQKRWGQAHNFITAASKQKQADKLRASLVEPEREPGAVSFSFNANECSANEVLSVSGLKKSYGDKLIFSNVDMLIKNGERVFILGANGCGKTTLLRILSKREYPDEGKCVLGPRVQMGYYDQNVSAGMGHGTLLEEIHDAYPLMNLGEIRSAMAKFLFQGDSVFNMADKASGGEHARIQLLKLMLSGANLLLLDEPTNHLDIASREALESALEEYTGTLIVVTHDRYLVNRLADRVLYMTRSGLKEYIGGYESYLSAIAEEKAEAAAEAPKEISENAMSYKAKKDLRSAINRTKGALERTEKAIADKELELKQLEAGMTSTDYKKVMELVKQSDEVRAEIDALYEKWEELSEKLAELESSDND